MNVFDPGSWLDILFGWFVNSWTVSGSEALQKAIEQLQSAPWPDLGALWFQRLWNSVFGLSIILGLFAIIIHSVVFMFRYQHKGLLGAIANFGKLLLNGIFLLFVLVTTMGVVDFLIKAMSALMEWATGSDRWFDSLVQAGNVNIVDIWNSLGVSFAGLWVGQTLYINATLMQLSIYFFAVWYLLGSALGAGKIGQWVRSFIAAALLTVLFARVVQIFVLGIFAVILDLSENITGTASADMIGYAVLAAGIGALAVPLIMFVIFTVSMIRLEHRLDVRVMVDQQSKNVTNETSSQERATERVRTIDRTKDAASGALRAAAIAATTLAITKGTSAIVAKMTSAAPTPQTKAIAAASWAVTAGSAWAERKMHSYINNRVGRPGASRARSLSIATPVRR